MNNTVEVRTGERGYEAGGPSPFERPLERSESSPKHDPAAFRRAIVEKLIYSVGKTTEQASERDWYVATALATRDCIVERWLETNRSTPQSNMKRVSYFSLEFLI